MSYDNIWKGLPSLNHDQRDEKVKRFSQDTVSKDRVDESFDEILCGLISTEDRVLNTFSSPFPWIPKVLLDQAKLLEQRAASSEEAKEKRRMKDSIESLTKDKWSNGRVVHVRTEPLIDVLSVCFINYNDKEPWEVYGNIYVHDGINKCFVYERADDDDPEIINPSSGGGATLTLTGPDNFLSMDSPDICIFIDLRDKVTGETIIHGSAKLFKTIDPPSEQHHHFEEIRTATVRGTRCCAVVKYLALTFGVFGRVRVELFKQQQVGTSDTEEELEVYGTVNAEYNILHLSEKIRINLFEIEKDCELVTWDSPITLARSVLAVPAYSSLKIHVDLMNHADNQPIVQGSWVIEPANNAHNWKIIPGQNGLNARVTFDWREPFMLDDPQESYMLSLPPRSETCGRFLRNSRALPDLKTVEVFSIFIGRENDEQLSLHGMVNFRGECGLINIFKRDKDDPYVLSRGCNLLPLEGPKDALVPGDSFMLSVDLEDAENNVSIKGFVCSNYQIIELSEPWLYRLLCSVVKGAYHRSFAAVHYSVFMHAFEARLKVHFYFKGKRFSDTCSSRIHGSVIASYGDYGRRTSYERLYYKTVLFNRSEKNPYERPFKDFDVELSRSVVSVPNDALLEIEADLSCCISTSFYRRLRDVLVIQIGNGSVVIQGDQIEIRISVEWREV